MKKAIIPLAAVIVALSAFFIWSRVSYNEKYERYYNARMDEYEQRILDAVDEAFAVGKLELTVSISEKCVEYYHLGEDVTYSHKCNGSAIRSGDVVTASARMKFNTTISEHDAIPDTGSSSFAFQLPPYRNKKTIQIRVDENGGTRYKDAYAVYEVTYSFSPLLDPIVDSVAKPEIKYWDVVFS